MARCGLYSRCWTARIHPAHQGVERDSDDRRERQKVPQVGLKPGRRILAELLPQIRQREIAWESSDRQH